MDPIANNPFYVSAVQSTAKQSKIPNISEVTSQSFNSSTLNISQDSKNAIVSEKPDTQQDFNSYNLRFQQNVPVSNLLSAGQSFNELNKSSSSKKDSAKSKKYYADDSSSNNSSEQPTNLGFYIVNNNSGNYALVSAQQKIISVKQQINKTYHLNNIVDTGSLVNVIYD